MTARHRRARPEKQSTFVLTLRAAPGVDCIRALRWALTFLWRRFGLRCVSIERPMTAALLRTIAGLDPIEVFRALAEARALLWRVGEFSLPDAVDVLEDSAVRSGLVDEIGADRVQQILADAFARVRGQP
jgi:hypothetical protein